tara:strand:+ start:4280 stop:4507 length:228 start_codon:yes stop_codon:yes gene_type:complete
MSETSEDMLIILKELVGRIKSLEQAVYDKDNLLMKSGLVVVGGPTPSMNNHAVPSSDSIHKMSWGDIDKFVNGRV